MLKATEKHSSGMCIAKDVGGGIHGSETQLRDGKMIKDYKEKPEVLSSNFSLAIPQNILYHSPSKYEIETEGSGLQLEIDKKS